MRAVARFLVALGVLAGFVTSAAVAQHPQTRKGFWIGFGFGWGSLGRSCDGCADIDRLSGVSGFLKMGGTLSPKVLIGGETNGWSKSESGSTVTAGALNLAVFFYPQASGGFFLKGGVGLSDYKESNENASTGFGFGAGLGYDLRVGTNISLTPVLNYAFGSLGDVNSGGTTVPGTKQNIAQLAVGITFH